MRTSLRARTIALTLVLAWLLAPGSLAAPAMAYAGAPAPAAAAPTETPLPAQMADVGGARQLLIATAQQLGDTTGTLQVFDLVGDVWTLRMSVPARFGRHGLIDGTLRRAGDLTTPTGIWAMPDFIFGSHAKRPSGLKMDYRHLTSRSWWSSRRGSTYNTWVRAARWTGEHIGMSLRAYEFAVSVGYNTRPNLSVFGRGTGIFLHVQGGGLTSGCISIARMDMYRVCKLLDHGRDPHFAIGTLETGTPTSIRSY